MKHTKRKWRGVAPLSKGLLAAALAVGSFLIPAGASHADSNSTIRVALYADIGSKYKSTVPAVTLLSTQSFTLLSDQAGSAPLVSVPAQKQIRISLDGYRVKVMEVSSWQTAADAAKKLQSTSAKPQIFAISRNGATVYQLYTGVYASEAAAKDGLTRVVKAGLSIPADQTPAVKGNKHLSAGRYSSEQEADVALNSLTAAGLDAWKVFLAGNDGSAQVEVWVGEAANDSDLTAVQAAVSTAAPQFTVSVATSPGLILRKDAGLDFSSETQADHYLVSGSNAKFLAAGSEAGIQLVERSKRTYRGNLELSNLSGSLAVINVVPLEQYLYAVVGGEVSSSWPEEALKAQAVAARSYALSQGNRFDVANVVDTTLSQVYNGIGSEAPSIIKAVDTTAGEVLMSGGKVVEAVFSSNSGGMTADPSEVWANGGDVFASVPSVEDVSAAAAKMWYYVLLANGTSGYAREDNIKLTGSKTAAGLDIVTATTKDVNIRPLPVIESSVSAVGKLNPGENAVALDKVYESGSYSWIKGPYTSAELLKSLQGKTTSTLPSSISNLQVTQRGPSGRAIQVKANGQALNVKYPDMFRSAFNGLPSTLFDIVAPGSYTVLGADGSTATISSSQSAGVLSASGKVNVNGSGTVVMGGDSAARVITNSSGFLFIGQGNGHGLGMSQWGVKGMADSGYDYKQILQHYYKNVTIVKE
ncbi:MULTISPECIES: SpoIID/LytB domain-containing protein [unclassified Paenibacillus]|uniref:SpoIID/LytB domain-containing protein n=1 Tax=unclassified Paenibacillus TaxID=185978 RepID=UPI002475A4CD|nr:MULTISPECIES: SpoIID/LytB domain-containing protein [unclassified Paenibacillus]MDH6431202.1 stage II sporulation protein D [Paenibacillus sp. PastH-4]MDH6447304.1 stage II sporulation protein D [Paenibacillus sp. PastF-4]MDH6531452.1 stage II sporulation protein D [Paenibacillus sp. PastH-3]